METKDGIPLGFKISGLLSSAEVLHLTQVIGKLCKSWTNSRQTCDESNESDDESAPVRVEVFQLRPAVDTTNLKRYAIAACCRRSLSSTADTSNCV
jgi:hypothetical protein